MDALEGVSRALDGWAERVLVVLGVAMAGIVAAQVFFRYALNSSLFWSEELARYLLVWLTFLGATVAYRRGANPGIDALSARLRGLPRRLAAVAVHLASLGLFAVMLVHGFQFAHFVRLQISPALHLPKWVPHAVVPLSGAVLMVHALAFLVRELGRGGRDR